MSDPVLNISRPVLDRSGRYAIGLGFFVEGHPVQITLRAEKSLVDKFWLSAMGWLNGKISFGDSVQGSSPQAAAMSICRDPNAAKMLRDLPYGRLMVDRVNEALAAYCAIQAGQKDIIPRLTMEARKGGQKGQAAKAFLLQIREVGYADMMRHAAMMRKPEGLMHFGCLANGLCKGEPAAIGAYALQDALQRKDRGMGPLEPEPIRFSHDWTGGEAPNELEVRFGQKLAQGAQQQADRIRYHFAYMRAKDPTAGTLPVGMFPRRSL